MGVATILEARKIVLMAIGAGKSPAIYAALKGPVSPLVPASALQGHRDLYVILDHAAAADFNK